MDQHKLNTLSHFLHVISDFESGEFTAKELFFNSLFSLDAFEVEISDSVSPNVVGIPYSLLDKKHTHSPLQTHDLVFLVKSRGVDDKDIITMQVVLLENANTCRLHPSIFKMTAFEQNHDKKEGKFKIYIPKVFPIDEKGTTIAKYDFNEDWYYGQIASNKYHGIGIYFSKQGGCYFGSFSDNNQHGNGVHLKKNFTNNQYVVYFGEFRNNRRHGVGTLRDSQGFYWNVRYDNGNCIHREMSEQEVNLEAVSGNSEEPPLFQFSPIDVSK